MGSVEDCRKADGCALGKTLAHVDEMVYKAWALRDKVGPHVQGKELMRWTDDGIAGYPQ